jgi:hypothetical protein
MSASTSPSSAFEFGCHFEQSKDFSAFQIQLRDRPPTVIVSAKL